MEKLKNLFYTLWIFNNEVCQIYPSRSSKIKMKFVEHSCYLLEENLGVDYRSVNSKASLQTKKHSFVIYNLQKLEGDIFRVLILMKLSFCWSMFIVTRCILRVLSQKKLLSCPGSRSANCKLLQNFFSRSIQSKTTKVPTPKVWKCIIGLCPWNCLWF